MPLLLLVSVFIPLSLLWCCYCYCCFCGQLSVWYWALASSAFTYTEGHECCRNPSGLQCQVWATEPPMLIDWAVFMFSATSACFYWLVLCLLNTSQSHLGRKNLSCGNAFQVWPVDSPEVHFLDWWLMGGTISLWVILPTLLSWWFRCYKTRDLAQHWSKVIDGTSLWPQYQPLPQVLLLSESLMWLPYVTDWALELKSDINPFLKSWSWSFITAVETLKRQHWWPVWKHQPSPISQYKKSISIVHSNSSSLLADSNTVSLFQYVDISKHYYYRPSVYANVIYHSYFNKTEKRK